MRAGILRSALSPTQVHLWRRFAKSTSTKTNQHLNIDVFNAGFSSLPAPTSDTMFQRANRNFQAKEEHAAAHRFASKQDIAKQPLPPKAGSKPSSSSQIPDHFKKHISRTPSMTSISNLQTTPDPLETRSANVSTQAPRHNGKSFASLYNSQDSFKENPDVAQLNPGRAASGSAARSAASSMTVDIFDGDFSDDDTLDLDFEKPAALPPLPPQMSPPSRPDIQNQKHASSTLTWSQSSPSHYQAPPKSIPPPRQPVKRPSPPDEEHIPPPAKKRDLPWKKQPPPPSPVQVEDVTRLYENAATPVAQQKGRQAWDMTASAAKAQKKKLKENHKASADDMRGAIQDSAKMKVAKNSAITLSAEQDFVRDLVVNKNQSVFFTGPAGTGKSVLMRAIIQDLKKKHAKDPERVAVTASTGLAACNIGGMTLHAFSGIGLGKEDAPTLVKKIRRNQKAANRWKRTKILVIDEISMVDGDLFDKLSQIGRTLRNNGRPWGGIQLVITGDFFQLPPVPDGGQQRSAKFAFDAATWSTSIDHTIGLTEVFRQRDAEFADMLNEMRLGRISEKTVQTFKQLSRPLDSGEGLEVTELFPTRNEVDKSNRLRLNALPGKLHRFEALDTGHPEFRDKLLQNMMAPQTIELKQGAQVMLIKNMDDTLVNGSLGTVIDFVTESTFNIMGGIVDDGYGSDADDYKFKKRLKAFTNELDGRAIASAVKGDDGAGQRYPLVQFHATNGDTRTVLAVPEEWKVELPTGEVQASRKQLPLILAWALSIHKAQGQTLERVKVDLGKIFEKGQAYVALSRATTKHGLQVLRFDKNKVMAHPKVIGFYNNLYSAEVAASKKAAPSIASFAYGASAAAAPVNKAVQAPAPATASAAQTGRRKGLVQQRDVIDLDDDEEAMMAAYG